MSRDSREFLSQPEKTATLLVVSPLEKDHISLQRIFRGSNWQLQPAGNFGDAAALLEAVCIPVVICERTLPDGDWKAVLEALNMLVHPPRLIVSSRLAEDRLWAEVLNLGGYDVLLTPFHADEVVRVVGLAWQDWKRELSSQCESKPRAVFGAG